MSEEVKKTKTVEEEMTAMQKVAEQRHKMYGGLVTAHLAALIQEMTSRRSAQAENMKAAVALSDVILEILDYGVDIIKPKSRATGKHAKLAANFGGAFAQAIENKMILQAYNLNRADKAALEAQDTAEMKQELAVVAEDNNTGLDDKEDQSET